MNEIKSDIEVYKKLNNIENSMPFEDDDFNEYIINKVNSK